LNDTSALLSIFLTEQRWHLTSRGHMVAFAFWNAKSPTVLNIATDGALWEKLWLKD